MSLPLSFMFQGLPGPVGDPGPKGSRVSGPWQVPCRWGPGWALPVPPVGLREIRAGRPPPSVRRETAAKTLPPEHSVPGDRGAAEGPGNGYSRVRLGSHGWTDWAAKSLLGVRPWPSCYNQVFACHVP